MHHNRETQRLIRIKHPKLKRIWTIKGPDASLAPIRTVSASLHSLAVLRSAECSVVLRVARLPCARRKLGGITAWAMSSLGSVNQLASGCAPAAAARTEAFCMSGFIVAFNLGSGVTIDQSPPPVKSHPGKLSATIGRWDTMVGPCRANRSRESMTRATRTLHASAMSECVSGHPRRSQ